MSIFQCYFRPFCIHLLLNELMQQRVQSSKLQCLLPCNYRKSTLDPRCRSEM